MKLLKLGVTSDDVKKLQTVLNKLDNTVQVTGVFDAITDAAVKKFQQSAGLSADGAVGRKSWEAICKATGTPCPADFDVFFPTLLRNEGGFVDNPADPGGATNKGVTLLTFKSCSQKLLNIDPTLDNLKALTDDQAAVIYKASYWDKIHGDEFTLQELANIVFDFYVNAGANATKLLQNVMTAMGAAVTVDGVIGSATVKLMLGLNQIDLYTKYKQGRKDYYVNLCNAKPTLKVFLKGWLNRVDSFPDLTVVG